MLFKIPLLSLATICGLVATQCDIPFKNIEPECVGRLPQACTVARVFGGVSVQENRFPYMVSIQTTNPQAPGYFIHQCSGTLIANRVVLTAAHCLWYGDAFKDARADEQLNGQPSTEIYAAIAPYCRHMQGKGRFLVEEYYLHEDYNGNPLGGSDIAVLVLEQGLEYEDILPDYRKGSELSESQLASMSVVGWGMTGAREALPNVFINSVKPAQEGKVSYMPTPVCHDITTSSNAAYVVDDDVMICGFNETSDACSGDSGGPMLYLGPDGNLNYQIGITSWGPNTACVQLRSLPGVYTKVSAFEEWLDEILSEIQTKYPELEQSIQTVLYQEQPQLLPTHVQQNTIPPVLPSPVLPLAITYQPIAPILQSPNLQSPDTLKPPTTSEPPAPISTFSPTIPSNLPTNPDCFEGVNTGFGDASIPSFYYDKSTGQCVEFKWSGRGGNSNNFATQEVCEDECGLTK